MEEGTADQLGVLVGWTSQDLGERVVLNIQTFDTQGWSNSRKPRLSTMLMTKSQAAVLANSLFKIAGTAPPRRRRGWLAALFGRPA